MTVSKLRQGIRQVAGLATILLASYMLYIGSWRMSGIMFAMTPLIAAMFVRSRAGDDRPSLLEWLLLALGVLILVVTVALPRYAPS
jgi:hypothetical protein